MDILVPIMTPTETVHPNLPSPSSEVHNTYNAADEDYATQAILDSPANALNLASHIPNDLESLKAEAQAIVDAQKMNTRKAFKNYLDEEISRLTREAMIRAQKRDEGLRVNQRVEDDIKKLEAKFELEKRALEKRMGK